MKRIAIIGGGPAGSMAAETLGRGGVCVTVFEEKGAWEKPCGGGLPPRALGRYPFLLGAVEEHKCLEDVEMVAAKGARVRLHLRRPLVVYSRVTLNELLLRRATDAGAEVVNDRILNFRRQGSGWRLEGRAQSYTADYLILAAGARSRLRGLLAPHFAARDFMLTFGYYAPGASDLLRVQFFEDFEGYAWAFPRPDHLSLGICGKVGESDMHGLQERLHGFIRQHGYGEESARAPVFSHLLPALSTESWQNLRLAGPGWALAGDAAGLVDPVTGEGIYFAMRSGELLAEALREDAPDAYPERVWRDFGRTLALGARMARFFYRDDFWGKHPSTRLVEFSARSRSFRELFEDLIAGSQSYPGLAVRMYQTLLGSLGELALSSLGREWASVSGRSWTARQPSRHDREVRGDGRFQGGTRQYAQ